MPTDLDKLQGTWHVTSLETDGQKMPATAFEGSTIVIKKATFTSLGMGATYKGTVELDQAKKTLNLLFSAGPEKGNRNRGIYKLAGDTWTICLATRGTMRPAKFATKPGSGFALQTLERAGAARKTAKGKPTATVATSDEAGSGPSTVLEGEWAMVSGVMNGAALDKSMVAWCKRVTRGDVTSVVAGPQVILKAQFTVDPSATPAIIDYRNLSGSNAGKRQAGIFEVSGDTLMVCMAAPGDPRPADFSSKPKDGRSYTTWRRARA